MGAVRNSNTRSSHASVEVGGLLDGSRSAGQSGANGGSSTGGGGTGGGTGGSGSGMLSLNDNQQNMTTLSGQSGQSLNGGTLSSHLTPDATDRRSSFSFLRRASDRRRRKLKMQEFGAVEEEAMSPKHQHQHHHHQSYSHGQFVGGGAGAGAGAGDESDRRDSYTRVDNSGSSGIHHHHQSRNQQRLGGSGGGPPSVSDQVMSDNNSVGGGQHQHQYLNKRHQFGAKNPMSSRYNDPNAMIMQQQRQRHATTTSSLDDEQQFTPDELEQNRRRRSINDRLTDVVSDAVEFVREESFKRGRRSVRPNRRRTDDDLDSEEMRSICSGSGSNQQQCAQINRSPSYRRRRQLRKSPKRAATLQQQQFYNNQFSQADASDSGSLSMDTVRQRAPHLMNRSNTNYGDNQTRGVDRADISSGLGCMIPQPTHSRFSYPGTNTIIAQQHTIGGSIPGVSVGPPHAMSLYHQSQGGVGAGYPASAGMTADGGAPLRTSFECEVLDEHSVDRSDLQQQQQAGGQSAFVPPQNISLGSPSARLIPDERIIPPTVPLRGRRLPQIPGTNIIRSAADFLHSSFYGRDRSGTSAGFAAAASLAVAAGSSGFGQLNQSGGVKHQVEPLFPCVNDSPTTLTTVPPIGPPAAMRPGQRDSIQPLDNNINFPRVSYSPTHQSRAQLDPMGPVVVGAPLLGLVESQQRGGEPPQPTKSDIMITEHGAVNWRRPKDSDEDDWC